MKIQRRTTIQSGFIIRNGAWFLCLLICLSTLGAKKSQALDRDIRAVLITSTYGMVAGTALGLVTYPMTKSTRMIFVGSSIGLYLGIAVGIYFIKNRNNPDNPLRQPPDQIPPWMKRGSGLRSTNTLSGLDESSVVLDYYRTRPEFAVGLQVYSF